MLSVSTQIRERTQVVPLIHPAQTFRGVGFFWTQGVSRSRALVCHPVDRCVLHAYGRSQFNGVIVSHLNLSLIKFFLWHVRFVLVTHGRWGSG